MSAMASQITALSIVYLIVCSGADQRKHQGSASLALCEGKPPVTGEFPALRASNKENVSIWWRHHGKTNHRKFPRILVSHCPQLWINLPEEVIWTGLRLHKSRFGFSKIWTKETCTISKLFSSLVEWNMAIDVLQYIQVRRSTKKCI